MTASAKLIALNQIQEPQEFGGAWREPGETVTVYDHEADGLITAGAARWPDDGDATLTVRPPDAPSEAHVPQGGESEAAG